MCQTAAHVDNDMDRDENAKGVLLGKREREGPMTSSSSSPSKKTAVTKRSPSDALLSPDTTHATFYMESTLLNRTYMARSLLNVQLREENELYSFICHVKGDEKRTFRVYGSTATQIVNYGSTKACSFATDLRIIDDFCFKEIRSRCDLLVGSDAELLRLGLGGNKLHRKQLTWICSQMQYPTSRKGSGDIVFGLCASIYAVYFLLSRPSKTPNPNDLIFLLETDSIKASIGYARHLLNSSKANSTRMFNKNVSAALMVEERALIRAAKGINVFKRITAGVSPRARFDGMLSYFRHAAWPVGIDLDCSTNVDKLDDVSFYNQ